MTAFDDITPISSTEKVAAVEEFLQWREEEALYGSLFDDLKAWGLHLGVRDLQEEVRALREVAAVTLQEIRAIPEPPLGVAEKSPAPRARLRGAENALAAALGVD